MAAQSTFIMYSGRFFTHKNIRRQNTPGIRAKIQYFYYDDDADNNMVKKEEKKASDGE